MINIFGGLGIGLSLTIAALGGISLNTDKHLSQTVKTTTENIENCSVTSVQICRSQMTDPDTGTLIEVSTLKPNSPI